jgi:hypothetical protein
MPSMDMAYYGLLGDLANRRDIFRKDYVSSYWTSTVSGRDNP